MEHGTWGEVAPNRAHDSATTTIKTQSLFISLMFTCPSFTQTALHNQGTAGSLFCVQHRLGSIPSSLSV